MDFFRWTARWTDEQNNLSQWFVDIHLNGIEAWELSRGKKVEQWDLQTFGDCEGPFGITDFPCTSDDIPIYSSKLRELVDSVCANQVQHLPIRLVPEGRGRSRVGYSIVNYLAVIDCLDREKSTFEVWTKDNLLFWEKRPWMLGAFRNVQKMVLDKKKIGDARLFRLWGWSNAVIIRSDVKECLENGGITGCRFTLIPS